METKNVTVKVRFAKLFKDEKNSNVNLLLKSPIDGFKFENGEYIACQVDSISIPTSRFTATLCELDNDFAMYRASRGKSAISEGAWGILLFDSELVLERIMVNEGEQILAEMVSEDTGEVLQKELLAARNLYMTNVLKVSFSERAKSLMSKAIEQVLF